MALSHLRKFSSMEGKIKLNQKPNEGDANNDGDDERLLVVKTNPNAVLPQRATIGSAGLDLCSIASLSLRPRTSSWVETGLQMRLPKNTCGQIWTKSSFASSDIRVGAGIIDGIDSISYLHSFSLRGFSRDGMGSSLQ